MVHTSQEMEHVVRLIPGVLQVRIACDEESVSEIHIMASAHRHAMQIVRDVESTLAAHMGVRVDRRVISVAQMRDVEAEPARVILDTVQLKLRSDITDVQVELLFDGKRYVGTSSGASARNQRMRTVAIATLSAVQKTLNYSARIFLEDVAIVAIGDDEAVISTVCIESSSVEEVLVGCAFIRRDDAEAAARAVLSAINRRHGFLRDLQMETA